MPVGYTENNSNNIDYRSNDEKDDSVRLGGRERKKRQTDRQTDRQGDRET